MAELTNDYLIETLRSCQLLALLFVCESERRKTLGELNFAGVVTPRPWEEFLDRFAARLAKLPEAEKIYLLGSHLQSVEEIDIYSNATIQDLLDRHRLLLERLAKELNADPRFG